MPAPEQLTAVDIKEAVNRNISETSTLAADPFRATLEARYNALEADHRDRMAILERIEKEGGLGGFQTKTLEIQGAKNELHQLLHPAEATPQK